jgi:hypothetical protein
MLFDEDGRRRGGGCSVRPGSRPTDHQGGNQEVNILTTRFGLIQACETDAITIPEGLLGFHSFVH